MTRTDADLAVAVLKDAFGRIAADLPMLLGNLSAGDLLWQPDPQANSIGWLAWHLARVEDDHLAGVEAALGHGAGAQVWEQWQRRFDLPYAAEDIGYGQTAEQVAAFRVSGPQVLTDYYAAVHGRTLAVLDGLDAADFACVVDERWSPPVTAGVRLVSVVNDITAHLGQIGYVRGLLDRQADSGR